MRTTSRLATGALAAGTTVLLSVLALAGPADASPARHPAPAPAPAPVSTPAPAPVRADGAVTHLGDNFSAGGYALVQYSVSVPASGTYAVRYTVDVAGSAVNTIVDGRSLPQVLVGAGQPVSTGTFPLGAGTHVIGTRSPDGYGSTAIDLVRVG